MQGEQDGHGRRERRDHRARARTLVALLRWLRDASAGGRRAVMAVPQQVASPAAAARILRRLAIRGLVRRTASGGWLPAAVLVAPPPLVPCCEP